MALSPEAERDHAQANQELIARLRDAGEHLPAPERHDFGSYFDRFAEAKIVLLGEATHGTSEFYQARAAITRQLIERHGFNIVAVEADWPDAAAIDRYVRRLPAAPEAEPPFERFPTWMWRNVEMREFVDFLRQHNDALAIEQRVEFRGLDVYSLRRSMAAVIDYLDKVDPERARAARERYGCLTPWQADPAAYGHAVLSGRDTCEDEVAAQLHELLEHRLAYVARDPEAFFSAAQNARIVRAAERYYRLMYRGSTDSWNLRDRHMFDTLQYVMQRRGSDAKAVVWAHNSHIGNASATSMGWAGEFNLGELVRNAYGEEAYLIGLSSPRAGRQLRISVSPHRARAIPDRFAAAEPARFARGTDRPAARTRDRRHLSSRQRIAEPLFRGGAAGAVRRSDLVRGDPRGDATPSAAGERQRRHLSVRPVTGRLHRRQFGAISPIATRESKESASHRSRTPVESVKRFSEKIMLNPKS